MPRGGALSIDTSNVEADATYVAARPGLHPGRYVRMRVSDTGTGMDQATIERAFEPFFTTKPKGRGTGLGLATVYGIVTQSGGTIHIYSEPELGTSVSVLLPATSDAVPARPVIPAPAGAQARGSGETILLAEDEESLRLLARRILTNHGYQVHEALTGPAAVEYAADPANPLDLLLTDVVMPDMLGTGVAEGVHRHRPGLPVLYMSGYAQPILDTHGATGPGMNILEKPFTTPGLLSRVHHALHPTADLPG
jgi:CheY-like chemotaxis protein